MGLLLFQRISPPLQIYKALRAKWGCCSSTSVQLTLWGNAAEDVGGQLETEMYATNKPIVSVSHCRVTDFNGPPSSRFPLPYLHTDQKGSLETSENWIQMVQAGFQNNKRKKIIAFIIFTRKQ